MEALILCGIGVALHPAVAADRSVAAQMHNVLGFPRPTLAALNPVMEAVGTTAAPLAQSTGPGGYYFPAVPLKLSRHRPLRTIRQNPKPLQRRDL